MKCNHSPRIIALLTDFGDRDGYVGILKGVILRIAPSAVLVDLAHQIDPGDVQSAAFVLGRSFSWFPPKTIHVVVVDPGVGSDRRPLLVESRNGIFIAPDNGVLNWVFWQDPTAIVRRLNNPHYFLTPVSTTFHGRDIFAPVAAHLVNGVSVEDLGTAIADFQSPPKPPVQTTANGLAGQVVYIDRFGNCVTNLSPQDWRHCSFVASHVGGTAISGLYSTYSAVSAGSLLNLIGSHGYLEIACYQGSATETLDLHVRDAVHVLFA
ncbi:SAM-dependent chlorinase/fluorinase [candidate division KSB1 bacterium]|nr:SAM-dependent chlorinase/fluorinase [candidate division KSB1 bacterium]